jgi:hypothetical protein
MKLSVTVSYHFKIAVWMDIDIHTIDIVSFLSPTKDYCHIMKRTFGALILTAGLSMVAQMYPLKCDRTEFTLQPLHLCDALKGII